MPLGTFLMVQFVISLVAIATGLVAMPALAAGHRIVQYNEMVVIQSYRPGG